jgi:hypothetical protein
MINTRTFLHQKHLDKVTQFFLCLSSLDVTVNYSLPGKIQDECAYVLLYQQSLWTWGRIFR